MKILFVASEVDPFAKTGGLADVASALPKALAQLGHDVRIIMPRYRVIDVKKFGLKKVRGPDPVVVGPKTMDATIFQAQLPGTKIIPPPVFRPKGPKSPPSADSTGGGITTYFVDQPTLFDRDGLYQDKGRDFPDNLERFSCFSQAVLSGLQQLGWQPEVVHCHDWQTALVCAHLSLTHAADRFWQSAATVLTIHNLAYQGLFPKEAWPLTNLPAEAFRIDGLEFYDQINSLKGGLVYAGHLSTVSPTYAKEIQTPEFGCGLEGVLISRRDDLQGILNGIDVEVWNPKTDRHLSAQYWDGELAGKSACKLWLQERHALPQHHVLLIGMIQRLAEQKGIDIFVQAAEELLALPLQLVILGTGDPVYHEQLQRLAKRFPEKLAVTLGFDNALAHQIEAGADAFLMPSRFEP
ncbi:MAG: glycogen synthase, partial [Candidatus Omnitrophica bacterium]|nr:glycogen synthase [Candidatus Omnitrophota bacterium]